MRDDSLLKLERKLDTYSSKDILLSKFILKPNIDRRELLEGNEFMNKIGSFISNFQKNNKEILGDEKKFKEMNIEEGAELLENKANKMTNKRRKLGSKCLKSKNINNNINNNINIQPKPDDETVNKIPEIKQESLREESENENDKLKRDQKYIELNLNLGILDLVKKENKIKIEELNNSDNLAGIDNELAENSRPNKQIKLIKSLNISNKPNKPIRSCNDNDYLEKLNKNDKILQGVLSNKNANNQDGEFDDYPFIDFKNDNFNKEVLNFLIENSKSKSTKKANKRKKK